MDNQFAKPTVLVQRVASVILVALLIIFASILGVYLYRASDPYVQEVFSLNRNPARGEAIFEINCAGCHGKQGDGHVGPTLHHVSKHMSELSVIDQITSGDTPPMPKFQPDPQEMADLLGYLEEL